MGIFFDILIFSCYAPFKLNKGKKNEVKGFTLFC